MRRSRRFGHIGGGRHQLPLHHLLFRPCHRRRGHLFPVSRQKRIIQRQPCGQAVDVCLSAVRRGFLCRHRAVPHAHPAPGLRSSGTRCDGKRRDLFCHYRFFSAFSCSVSSRSCHFPHDGQLQNLTLRFASDEHHQCGRQRRTDSRLPSFGNRRGRCNAGFACGRCGSPSASGCQSFSAGLCFRHLSSHA